MNTSIVVVAFTSEYERMRVLYEEALGIPAKQLNDNWCEFPLSGGSRFALHRLRQGAQNSPAVFHVNFIVSDVNAATERFRDAGAEMLSGIVDESFGRVAAVRDPDGREFDLVEEGV
jgi:predicted enzyme related to lactoylglutathione lyase